MSRKRGPAAERPPFPGRDAPAAAAAYYRWRRLAGTWHPLEADWMYRGQTTEENERELTRLLAEVDAEIDGAKGR